METIPEQKKTKQKKKTKLRITEYAFQIKKIKIGSELVKSNKTKQNKTNCSM
jgi:hypothetical protein